MQSMSSIQKVKLDPAGLKSISSRLVYLTKLLSKSEFWDKLNGPFTDVGKLDRTLSTICYGSLFLSGLIRLQPKIFIKLKPIFFKLLSKLLITLKRFKSLNRFTSLLDNYIQSHTRITLTNEKVPAIAEKEKESSLELSPALDLTATKLRSLSTYISDIRIFHRMWALPGALSYCFSEINDISKDDKKSKLMKIIELVDVISITIYQPLENIAFAADHKWLHYSDSKAGDIGLFYYVVSSRFWAIFVVLELVKIARSFKNGSKLIYDSDLFRSLTANLASLPLTYHWSLYEGCFDDLTVGFLGSFCTLLNSIQDWKPVWSDIKNLNV